MKNKVSIILLALVMLFALTACRKAPAESSDSGQSTQQPAEEGGAEDQDNEEVVLTEKVYGEAAFIIGLDQNQWNDASGTGYGWYYYSGTGKEVETVIIQDSNWAEGITDVEDVPAIVDERIDERLGERNAYLSYERSEDSREKVTVNGFDMLRVTGSINLDGTKPTSYDYVGYFFLANSSVSIKENCPSYLIALAKKTDAEDESYVYDQAVAEKNLALIDDIIQTYREI